MTPLVEQLIGIENNCVPAEMAAMSKSNAAIHELIH